VIDFCLAAAINPIQHVVQHRLIWFDLPCKVAFFDSFTVLSNQIIMQIIAAVLVLLLLPRFLRMRSGTDEIGRFVARGPGNLIEYGCEMLRDYVARPALGPYTDQFVPYIWSAFYFILFCNILGLIPLADWTRPLYPGALGGTSTGNIMVTAALAITTLGMIVVNGLRLHGFDYVKHFFMGPPLLAPMIAVLEVIGLIAKTFALAMRLFANMIAGHILLAVLIAFVGMAFTGIGVAGGLVVAIPVVLGSVAIYFLELFVAVLQAFIFTFLSAMFIGQAVVLHATHEEHATEAHIDLHEPAQPPVLDTGADVGAP
jgi:F-type H+-transporting ATPase subunit a